MPPDTSKLLIKEIQKQISRLPDHDQKLCQDCYDDLLTIMNRPDYIKVSVFAMGLIGAQINSKQRKLIREIRFES